MSTRKIISLVLIGFAVVATIFLVVVPMLQNNVPEIVSENDLVEAGKSRDGANTYYRFKEEVKDWLDILSRAVPVIALLLAYFVKKERK